MKLVNPKFEKGDELLIKGTELEIERVLTVKAVRMDLKWEWDTEQQRERMYQYIYYEFKESKIMYHEEAIIKKVNK